VTVAKTKELKKRLCGQERIVSSVLLPISLAQTQRLLREALRSAGAQAPCWGAGHRLALHRLLLPRQPYLLPVRAALLSAQTLEWRGVRYTL